MNGLLGLLIQGIMGAQHSSLTSPVPTTGSQSYNTPQPSSVGDLIKKYFPENPDIAKAVFTHESQLGKYFQNLQGAPSYGVAQINLPAHRAQIPGSSDQEKIAWLANPDNNLRIARQIYDASGWNPWQSYTSGAYKKYLGR